MTTVKFPIMQQHRAFAPASNRPSANARLRKVATTSRRATTVRASADNPARQALSGVVSGIYKLTAGFRQVDPSLPAIWQGIQKLDKSAVQEALRQGADPNERNSGGDTPLLFIAREGHYKYRPADIPALLVESGANLEAKDTSGKTALEVSLLSGWQIIAELLIQSGADTSGVPAIKSQLTCPDCKRIVAAHNM